jgi:hypothetical protein
LEVRRTLGTLIRAIFLESGQKPVLGMRTRMLGYHKPSILKK